MLILKPIAWMPRPLRPPYAENQGHPASASGMRFADMDALQEIARKHSLKIVEECELAHGGKWRGQGAGSMGDLGAFSFPIEQAHHLRRRGHRADQQSRIP